MRIYCAGPEVFLSIAAEVFAAKKALCVKYGHEGVTPFDADLGEILNNKETGILIAGANEQLIDSCDAVIANITPYHGLHADVGTVFEIGYARAKGKLVNAYSHGCGSHATRIRSHYQGQTQVGVDGLSRELINGTLIDDFGMVENAMVDGGVELSGGHVFVDEMAGATLHESLGALNGFELCLRAMNPTP